MTISLWVNLKSYSNAAGLVFKYSGNGYRLQVKSDGSVYFEIRNGGSFQTQLSTKKVPLNQWTYITLTHDDLTTGKIYIDGQLDSTKSNYTIAKAGATNSFTIGRDSFGGQSIDGNIDDVAVWDTILESKDISLIYERQKQKFSGSFDSEVFNLGSPLSTWLDFSWSTEIPFGKELIGDLDGNGSPNIESISDYLLNSNFSDGLVAYWNFNEVSGSLAPGGFDLAEASGNNLHGNESGSLQFNQVGKLNTAYYFDGVDDQISIANNELFNFDTNDDFTVSTWLKIPPQQVNLSASSNIIIEKWSGGGQPYPFVIRITNQGGGVSEGTINAARYNGSTSANIRSTVKVNDNKWHMITFRQINNTLELFIDGISQGTKINTLTATTTNNSPLFIASRDGNYHFTGSIDETAIWSRGLNDTSIKNLYRRGANRIKLQVKSCIDLGCECNSFNALPLGNTNDCDGDGMKMQMIMTMCLGQNLLAQVVIVQLFTLKIIIEKIQI